MSNCLLGDDEGGEGIGDDISDDDDDVSSVNILQPGMLPVALRPPVQQEAPRAAAPVVDQATTSALFDEELAGTAETGNAAKILEVKPSVTYHEDMEGVDFALVRYLPPAQVLPLYTLDEDLRKAILPQLTCNGHELFIRYKYPECLLNAAQNCMDPKFDDIWGDSACEGRAAWRSHEKELKKAYMQENGSIISGEHIKLTRMMTTILAWFIHPMGSQVVCFILRGPDTDLAKKNRNLETIYRSSCSKSA